MDVVIDFNKLVKVTVTVTDASLWGEIWVDGKPTGFETPKQLSLRVGRHTIEVRREGYRVESKTLNLENDLAEPLKFVLKKIE
jgi:hypothetical protein